MKARTRCSSAAVAPLTFALPRSHSPTRHCNFPSSSSAVHRTPYSPTRHCNFPSSSSAVHRTPLPTRAGFSCGSSHSSTASVASSSIKFGPDRSASQVRCAGRPISPKGGATMMPTPCGPPKKTCLCSPTNHPGSFRCSLHKNANNSRASATHSQLNARRSSMANSVVRIGGVEGEWVRRALTALVSPSSHHMRNKRSFQPRPSRLRHMTTAQDVS